MKIEKTSGIENLIKGVRVRFSEKEARSDKNIVYRWFDGIEGYGVRIFYRGPGESAGEEYHKGLDPSKNPERFFIVKGRMEFEVYNGIEGGIFTAKEGQEIEIDPWIWHATRTLTDVVYLKYILTNKGGIKDTYDSTKEEFKNILLIKDEY